MLSDCHVIKAGMLCERFVGLPLLQKLILWREF